MSEIFNSLKVVSFWDRISSEEYNPATIELDLTDNCNHNCPACTDRKFKTNSKLEIKNIENVLSLPNIKSIVLKGGGEPTIHPQIKEIIELIHNKKIAIGIETNGSLVKNEIADCIFENCDWIRFSVDSCSEKMHTQIHGIKNEFDNIINNIKNLVDKKKNRKFTPTIGIGFIVFPFNLEDYEKSFKFYKDVGVDYVSYRFATGIEYKQETLLKIKEIQEKNKNNTSNLKNISGVYFDRKLEKTRQPIFNSCIANKVVSVVCSNGDVVKCCYTKNNFVYGNLNNERFIDILKKIPKDNSCEKCRINCLGGTTCGRYDDYNFAWQYFITYNNPFA